MYLMTGDEKQWIKTEDQRLRSAATPQMKSNEQAGEALSVFGRFAVAAKARLADIHALVFRSQPTTS